MLNAAKQMQTFHLNYKKQLIGHGPYRHCVIIFIPLTFLVSLKKH